MSQINASLPGSALSGAVCKYCKKPIAEPGHFIEIEGESYPVCCPGCKKAAGIAHGLAPDDVYKFQQRGQATTCCRGVGDDQENLSQERSAQEKAAQENTALGTGEISRLIGGVRNVGENHFALSLIVPDIRCAACTWLIEQALQKQTGIVSVSTNLSEKRVVVEFSDETLPGEIIKLIKSLGYTLRPDETDELENVLKQERKALLSRLGVAGIGTMQVMMFAIATYVSGPDGMDDAYVALFRWASLSLAIPVAFYSASVFHQGAYRDLSHLSLGMDVPVSLAILAAFFLSLANTLTHGEEVYFDSVCMFTFFLLIGRYIESGSRSRFQRVRDLTEHLVPGVARTGVEPENFSPTAELETGSLVYVYAGEAVPADGHVVSGFSSADESAFTGEVMPVTKTAGSRVLAGSRNLDGLLVVEVGAAYSEFVINRISDLYKQSTLYKPPFSILADVIARYFVGSVLLLAAISGFYWYLQGSATWFVVSLTVLVVSCPCALSLATPVAYTIAATTLRKQGIVVSNGAFLERLAGITSVAFDKTGTLTEGNLQIVETLLLDAMSQDEVLNLAASLEKTSKHPIASAFGEGKLNVEAREIVPGNGVKGVIEGEEYRLGKTSFVMSDQISNPDNVGMWVLLAGDKPLAWFRFEDSPRKEAGDTIRELRSLGCEPSILTGDQSRQGVELGLELGIEDVRTGLSPADKVDILSQKQQQGERILMVGDGINDAAAMGIADVSVAVSPVDVFVQSSADATLLSNNLGTLVVAVKYARRVRRIIAENITWAVAYNLIVIPLAVTGTIEPWMAALGMSFSSVMVVLNANRLVRV